MRVEPWLEQINWTSCRRHNWYIKHVCVCVTVCVCSFDLIQQASGVKQYNSNATCPGMFKVKGCIPYTLEVEKGSASARGLPIVVHSCYILL